MESGGDGNPQREESRIGKLYFPFSVLVLKIQGLTPQEEYIFRLLESRIQKEIFIPKKEEAGENCTARDFITHNLRPFFWRNKTRRIERVGHARDEKIIQNCLVGKTAGKSSPGKPRNRM
jgi:hypothetical protein